MAIHIDPYHVYSIGMWNLTAPQCHCGRKPTWNSRHLTHKCAGCIPKDVGACCGGILFQRDSSLANVQDLSRGM